MAANVQQVDVREVKQLLIKYKSVLETDCLLATYLSDWMKLQEIYKTASKLVATKPIHHPRNNGVILDFPEHAMEAFENFKAKFLKILIATYELGGQKLTDREKRNLERGLGAFLAMEIRKAEMEDRELKRVYG